MWIVSGAAIWIALEFNQQDEYFGFWFNLYLVSAADLGFILLVLIPGWEPLAQGLIGPALWIAAAVASSIGYLRAKHGQET